MAGYRIDPDDVGELITQLAAIDGIDAVANPGTPEERPAQVAELGQPLELPGVVVQVYGYRFDALDSYAMRGRLLLVVADQPAPDARAALADLFNRVTATLPLGGEVTHEAVALPDRPGAALPALGVPFTIRCTPASEVP